MLILATFIFGWIALTELSVDLLPDIDAPALMVRTEYVGATAREIEDRINEPMEGILNTVPNLKGTHSFARQGMSFISLEFDWGTNMDIAFLNVREKLDQIRFALPPQAGRPQVVYSNPGDEPVAVLGITPVGERETDFETRVELKRWADQILTRRMEQEDGIAQAIMVGAVQPEVQIQYHPGLADRYEIRISEIEAKIREANLFTASGELQDGWYRYAMKIESRIRSLDDIRSLPLRKVGEERILRLGDVAEVRMAERDPSSFAMLGQSDILTVLVKKDYGSNLVQVYEKMLPVLDELRASFPGIEITVLSENATYIDNTITNLLQTLLLGGVLAFVVLFLFLNDPRSPLTIGISIPASIFLTFFVMFLLDIQLNIVSLSGLTLGIGLLVDNAIVVLENINRHRKGNSLFQAADRGTREIALAVTASTFTTISVFLPLVFLGGFEGAFFRDQALTLSISLLASLLVALGILPVLVLKFRARSEEEGKSTIFTRFLIFIRNRYEVSLGHCIARPWPVMLSAFILVLAAIAAFMYVPKDILPASEENRVRYRVQLPGNTAIPTAREAARSLSAHLNPYTEEEILILGGYTDQTNISALAREGLNKFVIEIPVTSARHAGEVRHHASTYINDRSDWSFTELPDMVLFENLIGQQDAPVILHLVGNDRQFSEQKSVELESRLSELGLGTLRLQYPETVETWQIRFRQERLLFYDITERYVINYLESTARGNLLTEWIRDDEYVDIRLYAQDQLYFSPEQLRIPHRGRTIRLGELAAMERVPETEQLERIAQTPVLSFISDMSMADWYWNKRDIRAAASSFTQETGIRVQLSGVALQVDSLLRDMAALLMISVLLIYTILAVQYENLKYPLIIMFSVPFAWIGSLLILWATGNGLNTLSFLGILILTGIAVNDAILKVDFMRRYVEETGNLKEAIHKAGRHRFRPVIMTTMTTILGLLPMVMPIGDGYEFRQALGLALMGGMITSTLLTLYIIPVLFGWMHRGKKIVVSDELSDDPVN